MDAEKLSKRDTLKRKEGRRRCARSRAAYKGEEKEEIKRGREGLHEVGDREKEEKMEREKRERGKKAWCNGGTSLRVSAPRISERRFSL